MTKKNLVRHYNETLSATLLIFVAALVAYLPFLDLRVLRMAGDEKVYLTQALEMARDGRWFVQTLADEPNYFKGPIHYVLIRLGLLVFGKHLIAGTWMNAALAFLSGLAMYHLGRKRWNDGAGLMLGLATALNVGAFSHAFVSQMEVEVFACYAFAVAALGLARTKNDFRSDLLFWVSAGFAGWSKSPIHSVLIAAGGLFYLLLSKQLLSKLKQPTFWLAGLSGAGLGVAGYLPAAIADWKNFYASFLMREQFEKANNGRTWDYVMKPLLHFALPWTFVVFAALFQWAKNRKATLRSSDKEMALLGIGMALPTILFWCTWSYKGQNYNLPAIPALLLFAWATFRGEIPRLSLRLAGGLGAVALVAMLYVFGHFWPLPVWWSGVWIGVFVLSTAIFSAAFLFSARKEILLVGTTAFFVAFGSIIAPLGEREMIDARVYLSDKPNAEIYYYNLDPSIWSEWALLNLVLHRDIKGLHRSVQLDMATRKGNLVMVQNSDNLEVVKKFADENKRPFTVTPWTRWLTKGTTSDGTKKWSVAWQQRDLSQLTRSFFILEFK